MEQGTELSREASVAGATVTTDVTIWEGAKASTDEADAISTAAATAGNLMASMKVKCKPMFSDSPIY